MQGVPAYLHGRAELHEDFRRGLRHVSFVVMEDVKPEQYTVSVSWRRSRTPSEGPGMDVESAMRLGCISVGNRETFLAAVLRKD